MNVRHFLRSTHAGATAIVAAAVTVMAVGASVFITDHLWLADQRDVLKSAADAAGIAATLELNRQLGRNRSVSDDELRSLQATAQRYVVLNLQHLPEDRLSTAMGSLVVEVTPNLSQRTVDVSVQADLGGTLLSRHMPLLGNYAGPAEGTRAVAQVMSAANPVEVVLAIDLSESMSFNLGGQPRGAEEDSRLDIVKRAATHLVDVIDPNEHDRVAIGVVPWNAKVRLNQNATRDWERSGWAQYPTRREYGVPYECKPNGTCTPPAPVVQNLPASAPETWLGCLDGHRMDGAVSTDASLPPPGEFFTTPSANAFAQMYYGASRAAAYQCHEDPVPDDFMYQYCYVAPGGNQRTVRSPQHGCAEDFPAILPLTTDRARIEQVIDSLTALRGLTYSALGVLWGQRLLEHTWNSVWGGSAHPADPDSQGDQTVRKAIVLLTDGEDTFCSFGNHDCSDSPIGTSRSAACDAAKAAGTEIFVVAAMHPDSIAADFAETLTACSSQSDNEDGSYVFLNNATAEGIESAFSDIATQLRTVRRVY